MKKTRSSKLLRIITVTISLILAFSMMTSCGVVPMILFNSANAKSNFTGFNDIEYKRPDFEGISADIDKLIEKLNNKSRSPFLDYEYAKIILSINSASDMLTYAEIMSNLDISDTELMEEYSYCNDGVNSVRTDIIKLYTAIIDNGYADRFLSGWTELDYENFEISKKLYDEEYVELDSQLQDIINQYNIDISELTIPYKGENYSFYELQEKYLSGEITYNEYYQFVVSYYKGISSLSTDKLFNIVTINNSIAEKLGYESYVDYAYSNVFSRDYSPEDIEKVYEFVKEYIVPAKQKIDAILERDDVRYMLSYAINNSPHTLKDYDAVIDRFTSDISSDMNKAYRTMKQYDLINMGNSPTRQQVSYTTMLYTYSVPFMFVTTYDTLDDITTFSHEFGHFYAFMKNGAESDNVLDVNEMQSQISELLFIDYYEIEDKQKEILELSIISDKLYTIISGCLQDEFLRIVYDTDTENLTVDKNTYLNSLYGSLSEEYGVSDMYPGYGQYLWAAIYHDFALPFYYISYAMSAIPSLGVYSVAKEDIKTAVGMYNNICDMNGYRNFLEVLEDNKLSTPFDEESYMIISELVDGIVSSFTGTSSDKNNGISSDIGKYSINKYSLYAAA